MRWSWIINTLTLACATAACVVAIDQARQNDALRASIDALQQQIVPPPTGETAGTELTCSSLDLVDSAGNVRVSMRAEPVPQITLRDEGDQIRIRLVASKAPDVAVLDASGTPRVAMMVGSDDISYLALLDAESIARLQLLVDRSGASRMQGVQVKRNGELDPAFYFDVPVRGQSRAELGGFTFTNAVMLEGKNRVYVPPVPASERGSRPNERQFP